MALTSRISRDSDQIITELVLSTGKSKVDIIEQALKCYRFQERMRVLKEEYVKLQANKHAWTEELKERNELEGTLLNGLEEY
jgi:hypothetical protein